MEVLECSVAQRIEGTHVDERDNKMWLVRYLEVSINNKYYTKR